MLLVLVYSLLFVSFRFFLCGTPNDFESKNLDACGTAKNT